MECRKCGARIHNDEEFCEKCKKEKATEVPRGVFLNQISGGPYGPPTNIPLQALAGKELAKTKFTKMLAAIGLCILLAGGLGLIIWFFTK